MTDCATVEEPARYSSGILHLLVGGTSAVRAEQLADGTYPGASIRRSVASGRDEETLGEFSAERTKNSRQGSGPKGPTNRKFRGLYQPGS